MPGGGSARAENNRTHENDYIKYMRFSLFFAGFRARICLEKSEFVPFCKVGACELANSVDTYN